MNRGKQEPEMVIMDDLDDILAEAPEIVISGVTEEKTTEDPAAVRKAPQPREAAEAAETEEERTAETPVVTPVIMPAETESTETPAQSVPEEVPTASQQCGEPVPEKAETPEFGKIPVIPEEEKADGKKEPAQERPLKGMQDPEPEDKTPEESGKKKRHFPWKGILITLLVLLLLAAGAAYGYGVRYYTDHFLPGTTAEGVALDNLTLEQADALLTEVKIPEDLQIRLTTKDGETVLLDTTPMNIRRHYLGLPEALAAQDKWRFFLTDERLKSLAKEEIVSPISLDYELSYDVAGALEALNQLEICDPEKTVAPADSYVYQDETTKEWKVMEAVDGNTLDPEILAAAVTEVVDARGTELDIASTGAYYTAQVREDDPALNRRAKMENALDAQSFTLDLGADTTREITAEEFRSLLKDGILEEDVTEEEKASGVLDEEKFSRFMNSIARKYSTKSASGYRFFKSVTGKKIAMQTDYGWEMDEEATGALVKTMLEQAGSRIIVDENLKESCPDHKVAAVWTQTAISHGERDTGESWVEVNLTQQKMYCVIDGEIVLESDVVSGTETSKGRRTPAGFFALKFKTTERDLVGYNSDGTEAYRSHVHYWMPVYNNIGLHDATWRSDFGGSRYLYSGSHGCVNLPLKAAKALYGYVYKGMPVIFYRENLS